MSGEPTKRSFGCSYPTPATKSVVLSEGASSPQPKYLPPTRHHHDRPNLSTTNALRRLDPALIETTRQHWPFLRDRRIDAYTPITRRFVD
jgi:hypothetical protein